MKIKIALLQLLPENTLEKQLEKGKSACIEAKKMGADIALFPEMWSTGYKIPQDKTELEKQSIPADSNFVLEFKKLAKELQMAIGITFQETNQPKPLNSIMLFDRNGNEVLHYSKVHTCDFDEEKVLSSGKDFYVADLDLGTDKVKVGSMICFDREFPESARILMLKGAELILAPNACPMEINRLSALRTRAYENMLAVCTCNYPSGQPDCNGHSTLFDGIAWLRDEPGVRDMCKFEAPDDEGIYIAELDLDLLRDYREHEIMGWKYRKTETYDILKEPLKKTESSMHKLIILRGNSGSGKTSVAKDLQTKLGSNTMLISQDVVRRDMLNVKDGAENLAIPLMKELLSYASKNSEIVILEGILKSDWYKPLFELALELYGSQIYAYYFDIPFEETLRRHKSKPNYNDFGEKQLREWWIEKDYSKVLNETNITAKITKDDLVQKILNEL